MLCIPLVGWSILNLLPVPFMVRFTLMRIFHNRSSVTPERIARYVDAYTGNGVARAFIVSARQLLRADYGRFIPFYRQIDLPVLIVWGRNDPIIPVEDGRRLHGETLRSRLVVIDECGHNPHEEKAAETCAAMTEFLDHFFSAAD
jgi:pimeloyl-ACP methyl ester carboxylesterase